MGNCYYNKFTSLKDVLDYLDREDDKLHNYLKNEQYIMNKISTSNKFSFEILDNLEGRILLKNVITLGRYENEIINDLFKMANLLVEKDKDDDKEHEKEHEKEKQQENDKDLN